MAGYTKIDCYKCDECGKKYFNIDYVMDCCKDKFNLSKKITQDVDLGCHVGDIKEFVQKIKATMIITPSPTERGKFIVWLAREIDKLAGDKLA